MDPRNLIAYLKGNSICHLVSSCGWPSHCCELWLTTCTFMAIDNLLVDIGYLSWKFIKCFSWVEMSSTFRILHCCPCFEPRNKPLTVKHVVFVGRKLWMLKSITGRRLKNYSQTTNKCFPPQPVTLNKMFCVKHKKDYPSRLAQQ